MCEPWMWCNSNGRKSTVWFRVSCAVCVYNIHNAHYAKLLSTTEHRGISFVGEAVSDVASYMEHSRQVCYRLLCSVGITVKSFNTSKRNIFYNMYDLVHNYQGVE